ncbi:cell division protein FtsH [candidate division WOR-1 bacterium RIFOXYB2_FULL_42_35]|uniref:ATP-dependent zinc metalloprotease FtsH n=1 Tax=candidate division WOR-1 bacterium RIFOXYC2_FULL_41_25 TaxID=1802586 RepID=A0A1F4TR31_UNCSA|nr:MAG: cell division protein FtsH [candidate division WOR-1 bacterium RIFOXYA2_FULL_41_14]OGC25558.1 MAG: cell division protein FtsH [candidate division WOR-1 bacterium RIFOXYB2_FULL_42_35]OGC34990.1 MAG: cell division protein FtsH [candidate division WOR-1 bacterium RIFOXYC2_FULL_41_25]
MKANWKNIFIYLLLLLTAVAVIAPLFPSDKGVKEIDFSNFLDLVDQGKVADVTIAGDRVSGKLTDKTKFLTRALNYPRLVPDLRSKGIAIKIDSPVEANWAWNLAIQLLIPIAFFGLLWWLLIRQAQSTNSQAMAFGKSRAKPLIGKVNVTFADVAGVDEAKEELVEIVDFLKNPAKFQALGAKMPKGLLLMGAPGTGKTLLARAIAGEAGVPFFSLSGSDFVEMFVGVGASRVRNLFTEAKKQTPAIVFMDEIDAVGRHRGAGVGGGHDEREQTLNQLLVEMDGFDPKTNIIIIAATNRPDILDPALLRPGRFDRQVILDKPDLNGREAILKIHGKNKPLAKDVDYNVVARRTPGFTGADLENVLNEAAILAARANKKEVAMEEVEEAIDRVIAGPEKKSRVISDQEKRIVAFHEVGHAIVSKLLPHADPVHKISILPRGMALGYTLQLPTEDRHLISKSESLDKIAVMLGGRAAEEIIFGEITSGAENDLERATALAKKMVCEFGMSDLGLRTFGRKDKQVFLGRNIAEMKDYSEETAERIDEEIGKIINSCHKNARELLNKHKLELEAIAKVLMEKETLENDSLEEALKGLTDFQDDQASGHPS